MFFGVIYNSLFRNYVNKDIIVGVRFFVVNLFLKNKNIKLKRFFDFFLCVLKES